MNPVKEIVNKVEHTISKYHMLSRGNRVIVAVSGGADSVCLLHILHYLKEALEIELVVAHFDHGLRPGEDEGETRFVKSLALSLGLDFVLEKAGNTLRQGDSSLEEKARVIRYQFLADAMERYSAQKVALGHSLNDQAETVLMRLLRGSGPSGLSGIPPFREKGIIRPLIEVSRTKIESYIVYRQLRHISDPSNLKTCHFRNQIRIELIPRLAKYQPRIVELLGRTAGIMREETSWLEVEAKTWIKRWTKAGTDRRVLIPLPPFRSLPEALKSHVVRQALKMTGGGLRRISQRNIDAVKSVAMGKRPQALVNLPNMLVAKRVYEDLILSVENAGEVEPFCYFLDKPGAFELECLECTVFLEEIEGTGLAGRTKSPWTAHLNADLIDYPLTIRDFRPGDRFVPFGMTGHKKLKDFFIDTKIPSEVRARIPILTQGNNPIWVCGLRIDDRFKISSDTKRVLKVTFRFHGASSASNYPQEGFENIP